MKTRNATQLKARINNRAREAGIPPQALMQSYLIERLLERLSRSGWRERVVVKGGVLISSLVGVASRTTMDLDTTVRGLDLTHESAESVFREVASVPSDDDWAFEFDRTEDIREADDTYQGISRCLATQDRRNHAAELVICEMEFIDMNLTSISRVPLKTA